MSLSDIHVGHFSLFYSPWHYSSLYCYCYWPLYLFVLWYVESFWWCYVVSGYKGITLRPMTSPWYMLFDFYLESVDLCWYASPVVGLCSQFSYWVWRLLFSQIIF